MARRACKCIARPREVLCIDEDLRLLCVSALKYIARVYSSKER